MKYSAPFLCTHSKTSVAVLMVRFVVCFVLWAYGRGNSLVFISFYISLSFFYWFFFIPHFQKINSIAADCLKKKFFLQRDNKCPNLLLISYQYFLHILCALAFYHLSSNCFSPINLKNKSNHIYRLLLYPKCLITPSFTCVYIYTSSVSKNIEFYSKFISFYFMIITVKA